MTRKPRKTGPCRTRSCMNVGGRARGAQDAAGLVARTSVFVSPSYYCDECLVGAAQRTLSTSIALKGRRRLIGSEGTYAALSTRLHGDAGRDEL